MISRNRCFSFKQSCPLMSYCHSKASTQGFQELGKFHLSRGIKDQIMPYKITSENRTRSIYTNPIFAYHYNFIAPCFAHGSQTSNAGFSVGRGMVSRPAAYNQSEKSMGDVARKERNFTTPWLPHTIKGIRRRTYNALPHCFFYRDSIQIMRTLDILNLCLSRTLGCTKIRNMGAVISAKGFGACAIDRYAAGVMRWFE